MCSLLLIANWSVQLKLAWSSHCKTCAAALCNAIAYSFPGSMFLPPTSALGAGLYSVAVYGGLVLFGMFLLYDTQHVIKRAETIPYYGVTKYDPINA